VISLVVWGYLLLCRIAGVARSNSYPNNAPTINACALQRFSLMIEPYSFRPAEGLALRRRGNHRS